jgi:hypothetical protein
MQVAQAVVTVEREPVEELVSPTPESEPVSAAENGKAHANQLTMFDLFKRHGPQNNKHRRTKIQPVKAQQLSLFAAAPSGD